MIAVGSDEFYRFCDVLTSQPSKRILSLGGIKLPPRVGPLKVPVAIYQYAQYVRDMVEESCPLVQDGKPDVEQVSPHDSFASVLIIVDLTDPGIRRTVFRQLRP